MVSNSTTTPEAAAPTHPSITSPSTPSSSNKLIVVGVGKWGTNIAREAHNLGFLTAIVDTQSENTKLAYEKLGSPINVTIHETLECALQAHPDVPVAICTPPSTHFACARVALAANRDVWVEKPLCSNVSDAKTLIENGRLMKRIVFVDHLLRYVSSYRQLLRLVKSGFVGEVTRVRAIRLNFGTIRTAENTLWSLSPHDISLILAVCDNQLPQQVKAEGQCVVSNEIEDYVDVHFSFASGARVHLSSSWLHYEKERRLVVYGRDGCIVVNESEVPGKPKVQGFKWSAKRRADGTSVVIEKSEEDMKAHINEEEEATKLESPVCAALKHFMNCCSVRDTPITDGEEGLRVLRVLTAASESLKKGCEVKVEKDDDVKDRKEKIDVNDAKEKNDADDGGTRDNNIEMKLRLKEELKYFAHPTAIVDDGANVGDGSKIWHFTHIMSGAVLGVKCNIGQNVYVGGGAVLGAGVKVQNNVSIYDGVIIEDEVFLGPHCVFTNVKTPRSAINRRNEYVETLVQKGATIGANSTIVCGIKLGAYCFVGAGAVVTRKVPSHALVYGNPARVEGWVSHTGARLVVVAKLGGGKMMMQCPESHKMYNYDGVETVQEVETETTTTTATTMGVNGEESK